MCLLALLELIKILVMVVKKRHDEFVLDDNWDVWTRVLCLCVCVCCEDVDS